MKQRLRNGSKDLLGYMDALRLKAVKPHATVEESFRGCFALLVQRLQTSSTQKLVAVYKYVGKFGRETFIALCGSISKCGAAVKI